MTSNTLSRKSQSQALFFLTALALQLLLGIMILIGLLHLGLWKTAVLEICKIAFVLPQAFQLRRASLEPEASVSAASLLATGSWTVLMVSAFADAILISYDIQLGRV